MNIDTVVNFLEEKEKLGYSGVIRRNFETLSLELRESGTNELKAFLSREWEITLTEIASPYSASGHCRKKRIANN